MVVSTRNGTEGNFLSVDEEVSRNPEGKGAEETIYVGDGQNSGMKGELVVCEHIGETGKQQSPTQVKAPPQKRRAVIRVKSAETQDNESEPQGVEVRDEGEMEELRFIPSAVSEPRWSVAGFFRSSVGRVEVSSWLSARRDGPCTRATTNAEKRASNSTLLRPL